MQRKFGGKLYRQHGENMKKSVAQRYAKSWRNDTSPHFVRVVKVGKTFSLYIRPKKK